MDHMDSEEYRKEEMKASKAINLLVKNHPELEDGPIRMLRSAPVPVQIMVLNDGGFDTALNINSFLIKRVVDTKKRLLARKRDALAQRDLRREAHRKTNKPKMADLIDALVRLRPNAARSTELKAVRDVFGAEPKLLTEPRLLSYALKELGDKGKGRAASVLLEEARARQAEVNVVHYGATMKGFASTGEWQYAVHLLEEMFFGEIQRNPVVCKQAIASCAKSKSWEMAVAIYDQMLMDEVSVDEQIHREIVSVCGQAGAWQQALEFMPGGWLAQDKRMHRTALGAFCAGGIWEQACHMFSMLEEKPKLHYEHMMYKLGQAGNWEVALQLLHAMPDDGVTLDDDIFAAAIDACAEGRVPRQAVNVLAEAYRKGCAVNTRLFNIAAKACSNTGDWLLATQLLDNMENAGLRADTATYNTVMTACDRGGQWQLAVQLLELMEKKSVPKDRFTEAAIVRPLMRDQEWRIALDRLRDAPGLRTYNDAIQACLRRQPHLSLDLFNRMTEESVRKDETTHEHAIEACKEMGDGTRAVNILGSMQRGGMKPRGETFANAVDACDKCDAWELSLCVLDMLSGTRSKMSNQRDRWFTRVFRACEQTRKRVLDA